MSTPAEPARPQVTLFSLGGTIAMTRDPGSARGVTPALSGAQLVAAVPALTDCGVTIDAQDFRQLPGASLTFADLLALGEAIEQRVREGVSGIVVTQGTDTIEETSYLLDLVYTGDAPVAVTGAMRNPTMAGPDGPANLVAAVQVAASPLVRGLGCVVVFSDEIHAAQHVRKIHSASTAAFASPNTGPIGYVVEDEARLLTRPGRQLAVHGVDPGRNARVALVTVTLSDDGELLRSLTDRFDGLVVAGFGVGHVPAVLVPILEELAGRIPVVLASRTGAGSVLRRTYGFPGSEQDLGRRGLIAAGFLDPLKARILLQLLLMAGVNRDGIAERFAGSASGRRARARR